MAPTRHEPACDPRDLPLRDGPNLQDPAAKHRLAGGLDFPVLRGVRLRHRLAHTGGGRRQLRSLHRPGLDHAVAADPEHFQCQSISNASFGIYFPKFTGTIYELLSAPISSFEIVISYVGAAATKSIALGLIILATAALFVPLQIMHPGVMLLFLALTAVTFSLLGFIIGIWADGFEKLQFIPTLIITPLTFLGGSFYSISMLPTLWQKVTLFNPVVYLVSGFRWSFYGVADVSVAISLAMTLVFMALCMGIVAYMFKTGYRLKS
jgi:ABC-2 type transport system permease protein